MLRLSTLTSRDKISLWILCQHFLNNEKTMKVGHFRASIINHVGVPRTQRTVNESKEFEMWPAKEMEDMRPLHIMI